MVHHHHMTVILMICVLLIFVTPTRKQRFDTFLLHTLTFAPHPHPSIPLSLSLPRCLTGLSTILYFLHTNTSFIILYLLTFFLISPRTRSKYLFRCLLRHSALFCLLPLIPFLTSSTPLPLSTILLNMHYSHFSLLGWVIFLGVAE